MTLGRQLRRPELPTAGARWCEAALPEGSVYRFLARERARLFPPELFADLFEPTGRRSVPPSILAVVMVLQRLEGLSDREAADRFAFDVRWRYAAGVADAVAGEETASFAHTVLVDLRARLRRSAGSGSDLPGDLRAGPPGGAGRGQAGAGLGTVGGRGHHPGHRDHDPWGDPGAAAGLPAGAGGQGPGAVAARGRLRCAGQAGLRLDRSGRPGGAGGRAGPRRLPGPLRPAR